MLIIFRWEGWRVWWIQMLQVQQVCPPAQAEQINYLLKGLVTLPASAGRRRTAATNVMVVFWRLFFLRIGSLMPKLPGAGHIARDCRQEEETCYNCNGVIIF